MDVFHTASALNERLDKLRKSGKKIGFVPTMGALHQGHLSLVKHSVRENDETVVSIFVNPTQFNNAGDLEKYPREPDRDIEKLRPTGAGIVFLPEEKEIYPGKVEAEKIELNGLDIGMEGAHRPGHFDGVVTVVSRLFKMVRPHRAYFGEKDFQQLMIIRQLARLKQLPVEIIGHPIERNDNGLALSSRNQLLSPEDQQKALSIHNNLRWAREHYNELHPKDVKQHIAEHFRGEPLDLEYVEIVNQDNLQIINDWNEAKHARIFMAASISGVRLIDNLLLF